MTHESTENTPPRSLIVLSFDNALKAEQAWLSAAQLQSEGELIINDAVFFTKDADGTVHVTETLDTPPAIAALRSTFWGAFAGVVLAGPLGMVLGGAATASLGALVSYFSDYGIPDAKVEELRSAVLPGHTALALLLSHIHAERIIAELERFQGATLVQTDLDPAFARKIAHAIAAPPSAGVTP